MQSLSSQNQSHSHSSGAAASPMNARDLQKSNQLSNYKAQKNLPLEHDSRLSMFPRESYDCFSFRDIKEELTRDAQVPKIIENKRNIKRAQSETILRMKHSSDRNILDSAAQDFEDNLRKLALAHKLRLNLKHSVVGRALRHHVIPLQQRPLTLKAARSESSLLNSCSRKDRFDSLSQFLSASVSQIHHGATNEDDDDLSMTPITPSALAAQPDFQDIIDESVDREIDAAQDDFAAKLAQKLCQDMETKNQDDYEEDELTLALMFSKIQNHHHSEVINEER